jgi:hypothetical protein
VISPHGFGGKDGCCCCGSRHGAGPLARGLLLRVRGELRSVTREGREEGIYLRRRAELVSPLFPSSTTLSRPTKFLGMFSAAPAVFNLGTATGFFSGGNGARIAGSFAHNFFGCFA